MTIPAATPPVLPLTPDDLLQTTRAVRKRLDLTRPVERHVLLDCLALAQQAPQPGNREDWGFVVVSDANSRALIADYYRQSVDIDYGGAPPRDAQSARAVAETRRGHQSVAQYLRVLESVIYLYDNIQAVPIHLIPCVRATPPDEPARGFRAAATWGGILPATWSFMLAARSRGLGTVWTMATLRFEREIAALLCIPYDEYQQAALIPVAYTKGTDFKPGSRVPLERIVHWNKW